MADTRRWELYWSPGIGRRVDGPVVIEGERIELMPVREHERIYADAHHAHVQAFKAQADAHDRAIEELIELRNAEMDEMIEKRGRERAEIAELEAQAQMGTMDTDRVEEILKGMCGIGDAPPLVLADPALGLLIEHAEPHGNIELHRNGETWTVSYLAKNSHPPTPTFESTRRSLGDACRDVLTMARETL